jgi:hypothetical protein
MMDLEELKNDIGKKSAELIKVNSQAIQLTHELRELRKKEKDYELEAFINYLSVGDKFVISNYMSFNVTPTGKTLKLINNGDMKKMGYIFFHEGDEFSIIRKNKRSITIEINKSRQQYNVITNPGWTLRVKLENIKSNMMRDQGFKEQIMTSHKRKEALEALGL